MQAGWNVWKIQIHNKFYTDQIREVILDQFFSDIPRMSSNSIFSELQAQILQQLHFVWLWHCDISHKAGLWLVHSSPLLASDWLLSDEDSPLCHCDTIIISSHKILYRTNILDPKQSVQKVFLTHSKEGLIIIKLFVSFFNQNHKIFSFEV